jgi:uncharacterized protein (TIGR00106 family)
MKALAEIQVIPVGLDISVRNEAKRAHEVIRTSGLKVGLHAYGTNVEEELEAILATVRQIHETLHSEDTQRITTAVKIGTRTDKEPRLEDKRFDTGSF